MAIEILQSIVGMQLANRIEILCVSLRVSLAFIGFSFLRPVSSKIYMMPEFRWGLRHDAHVTAATVRSRVALGSHDDLALTGGAAGDPRVSERSGSRGAAERAGCRTGLGLK